MRPIYRLFKRGKHFYAEHTETGKQTSLRTANRCEAESLIAAKNQASNQAAFTLALGKAYLSAVDPEILNRTWADAMALLVQRGCPSTRERALRAINSRTFDGIRERKIVETSATDFLSILADQKSSTSHYLRILHNLALDLGWLPSGSILPRRSWPTIKAKTRRAIAWEEHCKIVETESSKERRLYYEILWETGASQSDAAQFSQANINWSKRQFFYDRKKTGEHACLMISARFESLLQQLPTSGHFFPILVRWSSMRRSAEFYRRTKALGMHGLSLHSYRYAWAERAFQAGYPERFAQAALGHGSRAVHHRYARRATVACPPIELFEAQKLEQNSKICPGTNH